MNLTLDDIEQIETIKGPTKLDLSIGSFYAKQIIDTYPINLAIAEVLGSYIAKEIGLFCPKYQIVLPYNDDEEVFVISEDLNNYGKFVDAFNLGLLKEYNASLYGIWDFLEKKYLNNPIYGSKIPKVFNDIIKMYIFDILFCNWDRRSNNWGIIFNEDNMQLAIFDNEFLLENDINHIISSQVDGVEWLNKTKIAMNQNRRRISLEMDLTTFFKESSKEFLILFEDIFNLITPDYFREILNKMEKNEIVITKDGNVHLEIYDKEDYVQIYSNNYYLIKDIYHDYLKSR